MGSWSSIFEPLEEVLLELGTKARRPGYVGRPAAAAPAAGSMKRHVARQTKLVDEALTVSGGGAARKPAKAKAVAAKAPGKARKRKRK